jgi:MFS family permease
MPDQLARNASATSARSGLYAGWYVVIACFWMAVSAWGIGFYGHGVYLAQLSAAHGWSTSLISSAITFYYLVGALLMPFVSGAIERFGSRLVVLGSIGALCLALALIPSISEPWQLFAVYCLMAVGWAGTSWTAIPTILARWFDRRRGLAINVALLGASLGGIVPALMIDVSALHGFGITARTFAFLTLLVGGTLAVLFLRRGPETLGLPIDGVDRESDPSGGRSATISPAAGHKEGIWNLRFWSTAIAFSLALTAQVGLLTHQIGVLAPLMSAEFAGLAVAATAAASICGRLALGFVIDRLEPRAVSAVAFLLQALAVGLLTQTHVPALVFAACVLFGFWVGNIVTLPALIVQREFARGAFGVVVGLVTSISQCTFALGPAALGFVRDAGGSYGPVLVICAVVDATAAIVILVPRLREHLRGHGAAALRSDHSR